MKRKIFKGIMLFWTLFIGIGAVCGASAMLIKPDGSILQMDGMLKYFQVLPFAKVLFQNFIFPGIALLIVNGLSNLTAAIFIMKNRLCGAYLGCTFGFTLMLWIIIQFIIFPANVLSISYFIFGLLQFGCGILYVIFFRQSQFVFEASAYENIKNESDTLVVYFSRSGYTRKVAYEEADRLSAQLYEVTTKERTAGFLGFGWLGRFGMHKWAMPIDEIKVDVSSFKRVIIVTPIYVFTIAAPIRGFCEACSGKIKAASYILVHFRKDSDFHRAFDEMDELLRLKADEKKSLVCKFGNIIEK